MMLTASLLSLASLPLGASSGVEAMWSELRGAIASGGIKNTTECHARLLTYEFSLSLLPERAPLVEAFDALELWTTCGVSRPDATEGLPAFPPTSAVPEGAFFVAVDGSDEGPGSEAEPFATPRRALEATRAAPGRKAIVLRGGTYFLGETLRLDERDSGLSMTNYRREAVWLSGGVPIATAWEPFGDGNVYAARLNETFPHRKTVLGLNVLEPHRRMVRARYPNGGGSVGVETRAGVSQVKAADIASYGAPPIVPAAPQIYVSDPAYDASASEHFNAFAGGRCAFAGGAGNG